MTALPYGAESTIRCTFSATSVYRLGVFFPRFMRKMDNDSIIQIAVLTFENGKT